MLIVDMDAGRFLEGATGKKIFHLESTKEAPHISFFRLTLWKSI